MIRISKNADEDKSKWEYFDLGNVKDSIESFKIFCKIT